MTITYTRSCGTVWSSLTQLARRVVCSDLVCATCAFDCGAAPIGLSGDKSCRVKCSKYLGVQLIHLSEKKQAQGHTTTEGKIWIPTQSLDEAAWIKAESAFSAL